MTYRREEGSFQAVFSRLIAAFGRPFLADRLGVTATRLDQLANPRRGDLRLLEMVVQLDGLARDEGLGNPFLEAFTRRLAERGQLAQPQAGRAHRLRLALKGALTLLQAALTEDDTPAARLAVAGTGGK